MTIGSDIRRVSEHLMTVGWSAPEVHRALARSGRFAPNDLPNERTVQRWAQARRGESAEEAWGLGDANQGEGQLVLPVLRALSQLSGGRRLDLTKQEAEWIVRIRRGCPDLGPQEVFWLARRYVDAIAGGNSTGALDLYLAIGPWRGPAELTEFAGLLQGPDRGLGDWVDLLVSAHLFDSAFRQPDGSPLSEDVPERWLEALENAYTEGTNLQAAIEAIRTKGDSEEHEDA